MRQKKVKHSPTLRSEHQPFRSFGVRNPAPNARLITIHPTSSSLGHSGAGVTDLKSQVISAVEKGQVSMRPRAFFLAGSLLSALGLLVFSTVLVFALYLTRFALTHPGPGAELKLALLLASLPWYIPALAVASIVGGFYLLRRYDFSYKKNFGYILVIIVAGLWLGSLALERSAVEEFLTTRGYFRQLYQQNSPRPSVPNFPGTGRGGGRFR